MGRGPGKRWRGGGGGGGGGGHGGVLCEPIYNRALNSMLAPNGAWISRGKTYFVKFENPYLSNSVSLVSQFVEAITYNQMVPPGPPSCSVHCTLDENSSCYDSSPGWKNSSSRVSSSSYTSRRCVSPSRVLGAGYSRYMAALWTHCVCMYIWSIRICINLSVCVYIKTHSAAMYLEYEKINIY